ncbi:hypothetical protein L6164_008520 [Bauhinia variegata]|uniref:Uncharacterized protein n=1 Tax=Bauhinia variegata TaxID=167791 RepID=A0ACB9PGW2_BAUVA|nr:hypothetical protein L6164_008520 [Bauhinia variegata]
MGWKYKFLFWISSIFWLICFSSGYVPEDNILIDCGSPNNTKVGDRVFQADNSSISQLLSTTEAILAVTNSTSIPSSFDSNLYQTARIFRGVSQYTFPIKKQGRHWIRLYFFPFSFGNFNMSTAKFSVSAQGFTLLEDFQVHSGALMKEFSLNISSNQLMVTFTPSFDSFAFVNALEVISLPDKVIPDHVDFVGPKGDDENLWKQALETLIRVNMGNRTVSPQNDTLWRLWVSDDTFLNDNNDLVNYVSNITSVDYTVTNVTSEIGPPEMYGTMTRLDTEFQPTLKANMTWHFNVDPGFDYLLRFHFCDVQHLRPVTLFNVYVNSWLASTVDLPKETANKLGAPYYMDVVTRISGDRNLNVSVGTFNIGDIVYPEAILNGLEIMKMSNSDESLVLDLERSSKMKAGIIVGIVVGSVVVVLVVVFFFLFLCIRRSLLHSGQGKEDYPFARNEMARGSTDGGAFFSSSKIGYRFSLSVIQEATNNFSEALVIGVGGFGKVYKGALKDETKVAVKRGALQSHQGLVEFRTEIEMLSQFRHRHLVSLIGYCNEQNERIIIYEYMEKGSLKNHLYGSDVPCLSWKQRLEICIGAARGLYYLHTGSAKSIIHRDVKSANILLDENFMAKVADFGLSKTGPEIDQTHVSTAVKGSFGYLDPEYLSTQQLTEKSDVYSFGVVMFEVLCGRPVIDPSLPREKVYLVEWVTKWQERMQLEEVIDPRLEGQIKMDSVQKFVEIADKCLAEYGANRPTMGEVLWHLEYALRLQATDENSNHAGDVPSQMNHVNRLPSIEYSTGSITDMSDVSMSKVFAQMVREDPR